MEKLGKLSIFIDEIEISMINAIVLDDDILSSSIINRLCESNSFINLAKSFTDPEFAVKYLNSNPVDVLFLDIEMPKYSGIDVLNLLNHSPNVIFITSHEQYAAQSFSYEVVDYLLKPIDKDRFDKAVDKLVKKVCSEIKDDFVLVKHDRTSSKLLCRNIYYLETYGDYVKIYMENDCLVSNISLKNLVESLNDDFIQVHRKYVVNSTKITAMSGSELTLDSGAVVGISKTHKSKVKDLLKNSV